MSRAREIADTWVKQWIDPYFFHYLVIRLQEEGLTRQEQILDAQNRRGITTAAKHLAKARAALERIPRLAFAADFVGQEVLHWFCQRIDQLIAHLSVLGGRPRPRQRPDERHLTRFMFIISKALRQRTGRPHWREIADYVNALEFGKALTPKQVQSRCLQYRRLEPDALKRARREAQLFWGDQQVPRRKKMPRARRTKKVT